MSNIIKTSVRRNQHNRPTIWAVTCFNMGNNTQEQLDSGEIGIPNSRAFGWYGSEEEAVEAVNRNAGDIFEYYYDYCLIEEITDGIHGRVITEVWFHWDMEPKTVYNYEMGSLWKNIEKPAWSNNIINWSIG